MGNEKSECAYCHEPVGDDWVRGEGLLYCSPDCRTAGRMWFWICMLLIIVPFTILLLTDYSYNQEILLYLIILLSMILYFSFLVIQGIRVRVRVSQERKNRVLNE